MSITPSIISLRQLDCTKKFYVTAADKKLMKHAAKRRGKSLKRTETFESNGSGINMWQTLDYNKE
jgi:hypothetical protein